MSSQPISPGMNMNNGAGSGNNSWNNPMLQQLLKRLQMQQQQRQQGQPGQPGQQQQQPGQQQPSQQSPGQINQGMAQGQPGNYSGMGNFMSSAPSGNANWGTPGPGAGPGSTPEHPDPLGFARMASGGNLPPIAPDSGSYSNASQANGGSPSNSGMGQAGGTSPGGSPWGNPGQPPPNYGTNPYQAQVAGRQMQQGQQAQPQQSGAGGGSSNPYKFGDQIDPGPNQPDQSGSRSLNRNPNSVPPGPATSPTPSPNPTSTSPQSAPGFNSSGGYFAGQPAVPPGYSPQPTGGLQFPSPRAPNYNQDLGPALLGPGGAGTNPNANYGQNWQNYSNPYDMMYNQYMGTQFGPQAQAIWNQQGQNLNTFGSQYQNYNKTADDMYSGQNFQNNAMLSPEEQQNMIRSQQFQSGMTTPEQFNQTFYNDNEKGAITGDPNDPSNYFNTQMAGAFGDQSGQEGMSYDTLNSGDKALAGIGDQYQNYGNAALDSGSNAIRGAAYNPALQAQTGQLSLSDAFNKNYNFGQSDINDIENLAGTTAGKQIQGQSEDIERQAAAQGNTSPMALAAMKERYANDAASQSSDAATNARIQGRGLQLSTTANKENMRVGAEQTKEGIRGQAAQNAAGLQTGAEQNLLQNKLGFGQSVAGLNSQNTQYAQNSRLNTYGQLGAQRQGLNTFTAGQGGQFRTYADTAGSQRAGQIANQRTGQQAQNNTQAYGQNFQTQQQLANASAGVANQRLGANQEQRGYFTGQAGANMSALQNSTNSAGNWWSNWNNAGQTAANSYGTYDLGRRGQQLQQQNSNFNQNFTQGRGAATTLAGGGG